MKKFNSYVKYYKYQSWIDDAEQKLVKGYIDEGNRLVGKINSVRDARIWDHIIRSNCVNVMKSLHRKGRDIPLKLAIKEATRYGHVDILVYLTQAGIDISQYFIKLLMKAVRYGQIGIIKFLVSIGADHRFENDALFLIAVNHEKYDVVKYLASIGCDVNAEEGLCLSLADNNCDVEMVKLLITLGLQKNIMNQRLAIYISCKDTIRVLVSHGLWDDRLDVYDYLDYLDERHVELLADYPDIIRIITNRLHSRFVDAYTDVIIIT